MNNHVSSWIGEAACAKHLRLSVGWSRKDRHGLHTISFSKPGEAVRYLAPMVDAAIAARMVGEAAA